MEQHAYPSRCQCYAKWNAEELLCTIWDQQKRAERDSPAIDPNPRKCGHLVKARCLRCHRISESTQMHILRTSRLCPLQHSQPSTPEETQRFKTSSRLTRLIRRPYYKRTWGMQSDCRSTWVAAWFFWTRIVSSKTAFGAFAQQFTLNNVCTCEDTPLQIL